MDRPSFTFNSDVFKVVAKLILWLMAVYLLNVIFYLAISNFYLRLLGGVSGAKISKDICHKEDLFIFGASRGSHHYSPGTISKHTGLTVYNAADDGKSPTYQLGLLTLLLKQHKPRVIIYEVGDLIRSLDRGDVSLFPYYYSDKDVRALLNKRDPFSPIKFVFRTYAYNQRMFVGLKEILKPNKPKGDGYSPLYGQVGQGEEIQNREGLKEPDDFSKNRVSPFMIENFQRFVSVCESNQIMLIFTLSPILTGCWPSEEAVVRSVALEKGIPFLDYSSDARFKGNRRLFKDGIHLNAEGAVLLSDDIGEKLNKLLAGLFETGAGGSRLL